MANKYTVGAKIVLEGEKEYRQAINNCNNSMKVLKSELKAVSAEYANNANSLEALRAKNEILTKQQEEQEKKLALLRGALEKAAELYGENSTQVQNWQVKLNNAYAELQKINRELDDNQRYLKEAEESTNGMAKSIDEYGKEIKEAKEETLTFGDVLKANLASEAIISGVKALFNAIKDGSKALVDIVKETAAYADNILTLSVQTGIATDTLQELNYMAELTDTSLETITSTMARNIRSMNSAREGTKLYADAYKTLGVNVIDPVTKQLRDAEAVYWDVIDALGKMANETERDAIAMQIFGRSAQDLNPLIAVGKQGVAELADEARRMGAVLSQDTLEALGQTDDALQRVYQQFDIAKRKIGLEAAPEITRAIEKITDKINEADDDIADFVGGTVNNLVDAFIWIIDNADLVESALQGIAAAIVTKKAAEGIEYLIKAYGTLTTATQTATAAQTAFNTATKASVIGVIASAVVGLGTALYSYAKSAEEAKTRTYTYNNEIEKLKDSTQELSDTIQRSVEQRKKHNEELEAEAGAIRDMIDDLYDLADNEKKTNETKQKMVALVEQLNEIMPELNLAIDTQTGLLNKNHQEARDLVDTQLELLQVEAARNSLQEIANNRYQQEMTINNLKKTIALREQDRDALQAEIDAHKDYNAWIDETTGKVVWASDLRKAIKEINKELEGYNKELTAAQEKYDEFTVEYKNTLEYISEHSPVEAAAQASEGIVDKYKESMEENAEDAVDAVKKATNEINEVYEKASKDLEKKLKAERKAFEEQQEAQVKALQDAQQEQLKALEEAHKKKLQMIDEEYLEKIKTVDEERYNELKKIQDQIDAIDAQQEAEDRAAKLKEEADQRAELKAKIENAKTIEERMEAQNELAEFEEKVARERRKTERELQKDILEEQKQKINDAYDAKVEALKEEQKKAEETAKTQYENEKELINQKYNDEIETLKKIQEAEKDSFIERQEAYKEYLEKQKELAIENAKKTYDEDLRLFKLNNAMKGTVLTPSSNTLITSSLDTNANYSYQAINDIIKSYTNERVTSTLPQTQIRTDNIDYDRIEGAFAGALKKAHLILEMDGKQMGKVVNKKIYEMIK